MAKVTPYLRTEWGVEWSDMPGDIVPVESPINAREIVLEWNAREKNNFGITAKVVQRSISDWGDDE